jgi:hypothetical protein
MVESKRKPDERPALAAARTGTQSIERVVEMLRVVASRGRRGMRIADVATVSGLPMSTCFRMLQRLELEGLVERDALTRKYHLGPLLYELGLLARPRYELSTLCHEALELIAEHTQDTVYLSERRGPESICTHRALGDYPIKALTLDVGIRRPMGVGAGGLAILCALPAAEADDVIAANSHRYSKFATFNVDFPRGGGRGARARLLVPRQRRDTRAGRGGRGLPGRRPGGGHQRGRDLEPPEPRAARRGGPRDPAAGAPGLRGHGIAHAGRRRGQEEGLTVRAAHPCASGQAKR